MKKGLLVLILVLGLSSYANAQGICVLGVPEVIQIEDNWCWAACCECMLRYYGYNLTQPDLAYWACFVAGYWCVFPKNCDDCLCSPHPCATCCNHANDLYGPIWSSEVVLYHFGDLTSQNMNRKMTQDEIRDDVCYGKPFRIGWVWREGGAHGIVGCGYNGINGRVLYMDPWYGEGYNWIDYNELVTAGTRSWARSLRFTTPPPSPQSVELVSFIAVGHSGYIDVKWTTKTEINNSGFNLYRSLSTDGERAQINKNLIPARGVELRGASYEFTDREVVNEATYYYWLQSLDLHGTGTMEGPILATAISEIGTDQTLTPKLLKLAQNFPNPFNPITIIKYDLPVDCWVSLEVYTALGQKIATLVDEYQRAGKKVSRWDGKAADGLDVSSGVYFCRIQAGRYAETIEMVLLR
jgi:hypothetical protein